MGRKKSPVMRNKRIGHYYVNPSASNSILSGSDVTNLLGSVYSSSLRGPMTSKQKETVIDTKSSSDSLQLPGPLIPNLHTALPVGKKTRGQSKNIGRKRPSSGDDVVSNRWDEAGEYSEEERQTEANDKEEMVTMSVSELENWQKRAIFHVENHYSNEQLKRIAEFGRVHGTVVQEAKQFVSSMEKLLANQLLEERAALRAQAEEFVARTAMENDFLRHKVDGLKHHIEGLEKKMETLEWQVDVLRSDIEQNHQEQDERQHEYCEQVYQTHSPSNNLAQVQNDRREIDKRVGNRSRNGNHDASGYGSGSRECSSSPKPTKQINGELIDRCCSSKSTDSTPDHDDCFEEDQQLPRNDDHLQRYSVGAGRT